MARPLRIEYEGAVYHIKSRGNDRQDIFLDDEDRLSFLNAQRRGQVLTGARGSGLHFCLLRGSGKSCVVGTDKLVSRVRSWQKPQPARHKTGSVPPESTSS